MSHILYKLARHSFLFENKAPIPSNVTVSFEEYQQHRMLSKVASFIEHTYSDVYTYVASHATHRIDRSIVGVFFFVKPLSITIYVSWRRSSLAFGNVSSRVLSRLCDCVVPTYSGVDCVEKVGKLIETKSVEIMKPEITRLTLIVFCLLPQSRSSQILKVTDSQNVADQFV